MSTSFMGQALAVEHILSLKQRTGAVIALPEELDDKIAAMQLKALGVTIDTMTAAQQQYMQVPSRYSLVYLL